MGMGDDIISTALAVEAYKYVSQQHPGIQAKVVFGQHDRDTRVQRYNSEVFENNPYIVGINEDYKGQLIVIHEFPGSRIYIDYENSEKDTQGLRAIAYDPNFRAPSGQLFFSKAEQRQFAPSLAKLGQSIVLEPNVKGSFSGANKAWPWPKWEKLRDMLLENGYSVAQLMYPGANPLGAVTEIKTYSFRHGAYLIQNAGGLVTTDGGLHHAAGCIDCNTPTAVIWGHYSSPVILGYEKHANVTPQKRSNEFPFGCGRLYHCDDCIDAMASITVETVYNAIVEKIGGRTEHGA